MSSECALIVHTSNTHTQMSLVLTLRCSSQTVLHFCHRAVCVRYGQHVTFLRSSSPFPPVPRRSLRVRVLQFAPADAAALASKVTNPEGSAKFADKSYIVINSEPGVVLRGRKVRVDQYEMRT